MNEFVCPRASDSSRGLLEPTTWKISRRGKKGRVSLGKFQGKDFWGGEMSNWRCDRNMALNILCSRVNQEINTGKMLALLTRFRERGFWRIVAICLLCFDFKFLEEKYGNFEKRYNGIHHFILSQYWRGNNAIFVLFRCKLTRKRYCYEFYYDWIVPFSGDWSRENDTDFYGAWYNLV